MSINRRLSSTATSAQMDHPDMSDTSSDNKVRRDYGFLRQFGFPSSPEVAAARIIFNLGYFRLYYTLFLWIILFASLAPKRQISLILLFAMSGVIAAYLLLLRAIPSSSVVPYKTIDRRLVVALLVIVTIVALILTKAGIHLLVSLASGIPCVLLHSVIQVNDDVFVHEEASQNNGEFVPLVCKEAGDVEAQT
ncbi:hypothetical protein ACHQM5_007345 [Ranunculus cassubicifolius]